MLPGFGQDGHLKNGVYLDPKNFNIQILVGG
jgi:hypothetical protein